MLGFLSWRGGVLMKCWQYKLFLPYMLTYFTQEYMLHIDFTFLSVQCTLKRDANAHITGFVWQPANLCSCPPVCSGQPATQHILCIKCIDYREINWMWFDCCRYIQARNWLIIGKMWSLVITLHLFAINFTDRSILFLTCLL